MNRTICTYKDLKKAEENMEELVIAAKEGDNEAFLELIVGLEQDLYKIAKARFSCEEDVEDAVQETILQALKSIKKVKQPQYFKTWIIRILINKCNKMYQKKLNHKEYNEEIKATNNAYTEDNKIIGKMDFYLLIKDLSYKERITMILFYVENLTTKDISKILKESESTIRNRISRARAKIKKIYEEKGVFDERYR
jgi:RNA polymerase sigma-70 factor (ECF subfamily)